MRGTKRTAGLASILLHMPSPAAGVSPENMIYLQRVAIQSVRSVDCGSLYRKLKLITFVVTTQNQPIGDTGFPE